MKPLSWLFEFAWLVAVYLLLWASLSPLAVAGGAVVAVAALWLARLPPRSPLAGRLRPLSFMAFAAEFWYEMVSSAAEVGWQAVRPRPSRRAALVAVPVRAHSGGLLVVAANTVSLTPGSVVVAYDADRGELYVHGYPVATPEDADALGRFAVRVEGRTIRAFGSARDVESMREQAR